jgi:hypothetical protein
VSRERRGRPKERLSGWLRGPSAEPAAAPAPDLPVGFLEVRVTADRIEVVEFYSHGKSAGLRKALRPLGLHLEEEFDSPCG